MSPETKIQLFLVGISAVAILWNIHVLGFVRASEPLKSELAKARPFTKYGIAYLIWIVRVQVVALAYVSASGMVRNHYALPTIISESPTWATVLIIGQYVFYYVPAVLPALLLYYLVMTLQEHDRLVAVRLDRYRRLPYTRARRHTGGRR
jgi:hypothetical protein